ncbi:Hypothetical protein SRAE_X000225400 [Strongyloides ratti]|uniref:Uncharacterized protein n=1 Tax=Strongyloides ratti TaxID=34506 RepID=A0A090KSY3_STRRB|nr:Hypothetical protein SRAE_X000225400 [Strongyloides ratti]CEF60516.2 Hypothetical protein SRAE_X000225400 [Strongyloides ratti]
MNMNLLNISYFLFFSIVLTVNGFFANCPRVARMIKPCNIYINAVRDHFFEKCHYLLLPSDYANIMQMRKALQSNANALHRINHYISRRFDQRTISYFCQSYKVRYKKPTYLHLYLSNTGTIRRNSMNQNSFGSRFRRFFG